MSTPLRVESIFFAALGKKTTAERADYLDRACGGDAELRRRVERLLMAYPQAADFMARPAVERPGGDALDREPHPPGLRPDPDLIRSDGGPTPQPGQQEDIPGRVSNDLPSESSQLLERLRAGDRRALGELFQHHRDRLRRMVELRMDARLHGRIDASDVLQDGFLDLVQRVDSDRSEPSLPVFLWLGRVVSDRLAMIHRHHLGTQMRDVSQEVSLYRDPMPQTSSAALVSMLLGRLTTPSNVAIRAEPIPRVQEAVNSLDPLDREIVALRHFEQLSRAETAEVLGITEEAGAKRYIRALKKLKSILAAMPGGREGP
jgi:RNA polymerase sigma-70 factor, ECF subfamily